MTVIDERLERLMTRALDGEISAEERGELDRALGSDDEARQLFAEFKEIDAQARRSLRTVCVGAQAAAAFRTPARGRWLAAAVGVVAVAAAWALMVTVREPSLVNEDVGAAAPVVMAPEATEQIPIGHTDRPAPRWARTVSDPRLGPPLDSSMLVDYVENPGFVPTNRQRHSTRNWFGIVDDEHQKVYLFETNRHRTSVVPVSSDF